MNLIVRTIPLVSALAIVSLFIVLYLDSTFNLFK